MTPQTPRGDASPTQVPSDAATVVEDAGTTRPHTSPASRPSVELDPVEALRDVVSMWRARARSYHATGLIGGPIFEDCAADVEPLLPVLAVAVQVAYQSVAWLPENEVWVALPSATPAARAFAVELNGGEG